MISFIASAVVLSVIAILFIVPSLRKKNYAFSDGYDDLNIDIAKDRLNELKIQLEAGEINQQTYQQLHDELESSLALDLSNASEQTEPVNLESNKWVSIVLAVCIPVLAVVTYYQLGDFNAATGSVVANTVIPQGENRPQITIEEAVAKLEVRMTEQPDNPEGWFMLAKTYMTMQQYQKSASAYKKVIDIVGEEPELLLRYTDAVAMTEDGSLNGKAKPYLEKLVIAMPNNPSVLWMAGTAESQQNNSAKALSYWYPLRSILQDPASLNQLNQLIQGAESALSKTEIASLKKQYLVVDDSNKSLITDQPLNKQLGIQVTVKLDPNLRSKVSPQQTVFIFAKAMQGPPMPLAAVKKTVADLPLTVQLNDAMAMMPQMKLSNFDQVKISAVISQSGQPGKQAGDLFVEISPVNVKSQNKVTLIINQLVQ